MKSLFFCWLFFSLSLAMAQNNIGIFEKSADVGSPSLAGSAVYNETDQSYTLKGAGYNIWFGRDEFQFLNKHLKGDFILTASFAFEGTNTNHRKIGWMVRADSSDNAAFCGAFVHGDGQTCMQWRERKGVVMQSPEDEIRAPKFHYEILQLERSGNLLIMRAAHPGEPLQLIGTKKLSYLPENVLAGLVICSHQEDVLEQARVWNVRIDRPVNDAYNPYSDGFLASRLEIIDIKDLRRKTILEKNGCFEAPNWMPNGNNLLFNMDGSLYTIPVNGGEISRLNTGSANRMNNDHCISFNGKMLGISNDNGKGSSVFVLPLSGGEPHEVTFQTPSYLHGWSPDGKSLIYVAKREGNNEFNLYRNSVLGNDEVALSKIPAGAHVDGCEYSPDGKYIYYNGSESGTMQLWRMKPDGSGNEQLTFDEYNNWFPHLSPDGKWIVFISFPPGIEYNAHPFYKHVMLRMMPASGGAPFVVAYLYGGQGTINVNSWSPDSKKFAFVSNSGLY
jgi:hypothetical protein